MLKQPSFFSDLFNLLIFDCFLLEAFFIQSDMGAFVISKRFNDEYKFVYTSRKGKELFTSPGYELKFECEEAVERFKLSVADAVFAKFKTTGGKFFFKVIFEEAHFATSRKFTTELRIKKAVDEIQKYADKAEILDFSGGFVFEDSE